MNKHIFKLPVYLSLASLICTSCVSSDPPKKRKHNLISWQKAERSEYLGPLALHQCFASTEGVVIFGGLRDDRDFDPYHSRTAVYNPKKGGWRQLKVTEETNHFKDQVGAVFQNNLFVFGGDTLVGKYNTVPQVIDIKTGGIKQIASSTIDGRKRHSITVVEDKAVIFGGQGKVERLNLGFYDFSNDTFATYRLPPRVKNRTSFVAQASDEHLIIWGGFENNQKVNSGYMLNIKLMEWTDISDSPILSPRANAKSLTFGGKILIYGGAPVDGNSNTGAIYHIKDRRWTAIPPIPDKRYEKINNPSLTRISKYEALLWGGRMGNQEFLSEGWIYNLLTDSWSNFNQIYPPVGRMHHCLVKKDNYLLLYGGITKDQAGGFHHIIQPWIYF